MHIVAGLWKLVSAPSLDGEEETDKPEAQSLGPITARRLATALRKVEAALRRLIVLYMNTQDLKQGPGIKRPVPRPDFSYFSGNMADRAPSFGLIDPRKQLIFCLDKAEGPAQAIRANAVPRVHFWSEDQPHAALQGGCVPEGDAAEEGAENTQSAERLLKRLAAVERALKTIPQQARRMARLVEKRHKAPPGPGSVPPIRPGFPPGFCNRSEDAADRVLRECHGLVRDWERGSVP